MRYWVLLKKDYEREHIASFKEADDAILFAKTKASKYKNESLLQVYDSMTEDKEGTIAGAKIWEI